MNAQADPCENFYAYACGSWMQKTERPEDVLSVSRGFSSLAERVDSTLFELFHDADTPKVADFFKECTNNVQRNEQQTSPLQPWLQLIDDATTIESIFFVLGRMHAFNMNPLFDIYTDVDEEDPDTYFSMLYPAGWGLDDPNLLLDPPPGVQEAYVTRVATLLELGGESGADSGVPAKEQAKAVWNFEYYLLLYTLLNTEAEGEQQGEQSGGDAAQGQGQGRGQGQGPGGASSPAGGVAGGVGSVAHGATGQNRGGGSDQNQNRGDASLNSLTAKARRSALEKLPPVPRSVKDFAQLDVPKTAHPNAMARNVMHALRSRASPDGGSRACTKDSFEPCALWGMKLARDNGGGNGGGNGNGNGNGGGGGGDEGFPDPMDLGEPGQETAQDLPWKEFFEGAGFPNVFNELGKSVDLHPGLDALAQLLPQVPVLMVQDYLKSVLLRSTETFLTTDFLRTNFNEPRPG